MVSLSLLKYCEKLLCSVAFCQSSAHQARHAEHLQHAASFPHSSYYNINCGKVDLISNQLPARASPFLFMTEATSMPRPTFSAPQKILRHLAKAEILPRICCGRGPRPDGDGERGWNINKSRSPNSAAFTCSSCVSAVSFCWMPNTDYKVQVESISMLQQHSTALWGSDVTF